MKGDLTAKSNTRHETTTARPGSNTSAWRFWRLETVAGTLLAALLGAVLFAALAQVPARHPVDIGGFDAAYVQGFHDPERVDRASERPYLAGSDGSARWTRASSFLLFPQLGAPAELTLRLRAANPAGADVLVLLDGVTELGRVRATTDWQEYRLAVRGGWLKPSDVVVELRTTPERLSASDARQVGVLVDRVTFAVAGLPIVPYPAQLLYGALTGALLFLLARERRAAFVGGLLALGALYLLLYRLQPPYPYPLRQLPQLFVLAGGALLALRDGPAVVRRAPWLVDAAALGAIGIWLVAVGLRMQAHLVLSVPGVEKDFRVFATRAFDPAEVFRADGFYNLGYPLLLWLATPLAQGNPFLAARAISAVSGVALLLATWWLARCIAGRGAALIAVVALASSAFVTQYALYVGSDMLFAAVCTAALALLVWSAETPQRRWLVFGAGIAAGAAFLVRHPGLALLPVGWLALWWVRRAHGRAGVKQAGGRAFARWWAGLALVYTLGFGVAILPQLLVNLRDTGQPLYNQQAKNVWLAVYGDGDWGRWAETSDSIGLTDVVLRDPARVARAWWANVRAFFGTGAEDTGEFGRALQLRLLGFPANWLALGGLLGWLGMLVAQRNPERRDVADGDPSPVHAGVVVLLVWLLVYVVAVSVGLSLPRFFLPLAPVYAVAAGWAAVRLGALVLPHTNETRRLIIATLVLVPLLWSGFNAGATYVVRPQPDAVTPGQPPETLAAARLVAETLAPGERVVIQIAPADEEGLALTKYSAIAHIVAPETSDAVGAAYILWSGDLGSPPAGQVIGSAGRYILLRRTP